MKAIVSSSSSSRSYLKNESW